MSPDSYVKIQLVLLGLLLIASDLKLKQSKFEVDLKLFEVDLKSKKLTNLAQNHAIAG